MFGTTVDEDYEDSEQHDEPPADDEDVLSGAFRSLWAWVGGCCAGVPTETAVFTCLSAAIAV